MTGRMPFGIKFTRVNLICIVALLFLLSICFAETVVLKSGKILEGNITEDTKEFIKIETTDGKPLYLYKNTIEIIKKDSEETTSSVASTQVSLRTGLLDYSDKGYMLFVPKSISSVSPASILICLPGWGIRAKQDIYNWAFVAGKRNFVVVDLDVDYNRIHSRELYPRIFNIIASLAQEYPINQDKIYIAGTSAGGIMSIALALRYPDKFVAVGVVSGGRLGFGARHYLKNAKGVHFYMVHGQRDRAISIGEFHSTKKQLVRNGAIIEFNVLPQGEHTLPSHAYREVVDWLSKAR
jgi:poly(3-hydroxybutyrate) depolymerase